MKLADSKTFSIIQNENSNEYVKDKNNIYFCAINVEKNQDPKPFCRILE
ncbi:MAG: DKNYY domain-containing protein [Candidatus Peribacteria bacterium]|nr:DKNYY domain-containing protein [Candidatus Peribacteria bacterium]